MEIKVRKATKKDIPKIIEHWVALFELHMKKFGYDTELFRHKKNSILLFKRFITKRTRARNAAVYIAECDGKTIGHVIVSIDKLPPILVHDKQGYIDEIFVEEKYRKKGVGRALISAAERWASDKGLYSLGLMVCIKNEPALSAYRRFGFFDHHYKMSKIIK